jgi:hypothetical protein
MSIISSTTPGIDAKLSTIGWKRVTHRWRHERTKSLADSGEIPDQPLGFKPSPRDAVVYNVEPYRAGVRGGTGSWCGRRSCRSARSSFTSSPNCWRRRRRIRASLEHKRSSRTYQQIAVLLRPLT